MYHSSQRPVGPYQAWWGRDNHGGRQHCGAVIRFPLQRSWDDRRCDEMMRYVCECNAVKRRKPDLAVVKDEELF